MIRHAVIVTSVLIGSFEFAFESVASGPNATAQSADALPVESGVADGSAVAGNPLLSSQLIMQHLDIANVDVRYVHVEAEVGAPFEAQVVLDSEEYTLEMTPRSLRAADFMLLVADDEGIHEVVPEEPRTYRGVILDSEGKVVPDGGATATMQDGELTAMVQLGAGQTWFVESLSMAGLDAGPGMHAVFKGSDSVASGLHQCGVEDPPVPLSDEGGDDSTEGPAPRGTTFKVADIAFDGDFQFYQQNGSNVTTAMVDIESFFNVIEFIYERDTDISYEVTAITIRTTLGSDPYTSGNCGTMLNQFAAEWNANFGGLRRDTAHLITGQNLGTCGGIAFVGTVCNPSNSYGLTQHYPFSTQVAVSAHEIGHNWNACHCDESPPDCTISNPCRIMCSGAAGCPGAPQDFGPQAISQIVAFKNTRTCLFPGGAGTLADPVPFPFNETFPNTTLDETKWVYNDLALINTNGTNEPSASFSLNLDSTGSGEFDQNEVRTNNILAGGQTELEVSYYTQHQGVENGEQLIVEYWASNFRWVQLNAITSNGVDQTNYDFHSHSITASTALHNEFRLKFRTIGSDASDDWYVDDVTIVPSGADFTPPEPAPTIIAVTEFDTKVQMESSVATDADSPPVEYFFNGNDAQGSTDSPWQVNTIYTDTGLTPDVGYVYQVKARDQSGNETALSNFVIARTLASVPGAPALANATETTFDVDPDPSINPSGTNFAIRITATSPNDPTWNGMYVDATGNPSAGETWRTDSQWGNTTVLGAQSDTEYTVAVKARNQASVETGFGPSNSITTLPGVPTCSLLGDIDQDGLRTGSDIAGYVRAKLGAAPAPGEDQSCADFGNGDLDLDTADFVSALLSG